ncbi:MAG: AsmA-like C-terminal domain-containing protein, partial [Deltaproteobacteria bacterium]|nr:AsmA-like C-terminal domain-containing protein [Deltaproteobacteria bacterium]
SIPLLPLTYNNQEVVFKSVNIEGTLNIAQDMTSISILDLNLDYPRLDLTGDFVMDKSPPRVSLKLKGREVDVLSLREVALSIGGDISTVQNIFAIVKGGKVPLISLETNGKTLDDLGKLENILIKGSMLGGEIHIPGIDLNLTDVKGETLISEGILNGKRLQTRLGKIFGSKGNLRLGLGENNDLFRLDIMLKADLKQAFSILKGLIKDESLLRELRSINAIRKIPYPVEIMGTHFSYANGVIKVGELDGSLGKTSFSNISGMLDWRKELYMEIESAKANIILDEIYPWVSSYAKAKQTIKQIEGLKGLITLNTLDFKGPLFRPKAWRFKTECAIKDFTLSSTLLPGQLTLTEGRIEAGPQKLILKNARMDILDANLDLSAAAKGYMDGLNRLEATFEGNMGIEAIRSISELINLPEDIRAISPVTVSKADLLWDKKTGTSFKGNLSTPKGLDISLNVLKTPGMLKIDNLTIKDDKSDASFDCNIQEDAVSIRFAGNLDKTSLDSLLAKNRLLNGWIKGNLWARIIPGSAIESTIEGHLQGGDITFHELNLPVRIERFSFEAGQQRVILKSADLAVDDTEISATGTLDLSEQGILFDLGLSSDDFELEDIINVFDKKGKKTETKKGKNRWSLPIKGTTRVKLDSLTFRKLRWKPFNCNISAEGEVVNVTVTKANLCGISTAGTLKISPEGIGLDFKLLTKNMPLTKTIACVSKKRVAVDGTLDFESRIKGQGMGPQLIKSLHGPFKFTARDGRINRAPLFSRILSLLNVTEIFSGKLPDLASEGFAYNSITGEGNLKNGKVHLAKVLMDGSTLNLAGHGDIDLLEDKLDLKVFAAPFKTIDRIIRILPIIGYVLDDTLISIALKVTGKLQDPKVEYLPVDEIGSGLMGIMKRTLEVPINVVEPIIPMEKEKKE